MSVSGAPPVRFGGRSLSRALVPWLGELAGPASSARTEDLLLSAQQEVFDWLQHLDDLADGQSQARVRAARGLASAERRLRRLFPAGQPFWRAWEVLLREQRQSQEWEVARRARPLMAFDKALLRRLGSKAALLRWPAWAYAALGDDARSARRLDAVSGRVLTAAILLDDLGDFEEDLERRQVNAVLCAGRISSRQDVYDFYPAAAGGALRVCAAAQGLLQPLERRHPGTALARGCAALRASFSQAGRDTVARCRSRTMAASLASFSPAPRRPAP